MLHNKKKYPEKEVSGKIIAFFFLKRILHFFTGALVYQEGMIYLKFIIPSW